MSISIDSAAAAAMSSSVAAGLAVASAGALTLGYGMFVPRSQLLCPVISRGHARAGPRVALTFDDGPWPGSTDVILDILRQKDVKAAFFVIGRYVRQWPDLVRRMHDEGHLIGNHTFDHHRWGLFRGKRYWLDQLARTDEAIAEITGAPTRLFRAPMGFKSPPLARAARQSDKTIIAWSRRSYDGVRSKPDRIVRALEGRVKAGDIVLMHDGRDPASRRDAAPTARALPRVIDNLGAQGLNLARLDELIGGCGVSVSNSTGPPRQHPQ